MEQNDFRDTSREGFTLRQDARRPAAVPPAEGAFASFSQAHFSRSVNNNTQTLISTPIDEYTVPGQTDITGVTERSTVPGTFGIQTDTDGFYIVWANIWCTTTIVNTVRIELTSMSSGAPVNGIISAAYGVAIMRPGEFNSEGNNAINLVLPLMITDDSSSAFNGMLGGHGTPNRANVVVLHTEGAARTFHMEMAIGLVAPHD